MGFLRSFAVAVAVISVLLAIGFNYSADVRYTMCFMANVGYLDFMGPSYNQYWEQCLTDASDMFLKRDYQAGAGTITKVHEVDCSNGFTFEQFRDESDGFTKPFVCRGLLKENECRKWDLDHFVDIAREDEWLRLLDLGNETYTRKAFTINNYPSVMMKGPETFKNIREGKPLYVSFDNAFLTEEHPELIKQMDLDTLFPGIKFILNTLFISNFPQKIMGSAFHAAPNDNFLFQCRGRKHWYYLEPKFLPYVGAFISNGVTFVSKNADEEAIVDRLPLYEAIIEEGDAMYNPPYWLHAVGTPPGLSISIANRVWQNFFVQRDPTTMYWDAAYKFQFPQFAIKVAAKRLMKKLVGDSYKTNSLELRDKEREAYVPDAGVLPIID